MQQWGLLRNSVALIGWGDRPEALNWVGVVLSCCFQSTAVQRGEERVLVLCLVGFLGWSWSLRKNTQSSAKGFGIVLYLSWVCSKVLMIENLSFRITYWRFLVAVTKQNLLCYNGRTSSRVYFFSLYGSSWIGSSPRCSFAVLQQILILIIVCGASVYSQHYFLVFLSLRKWDSGQDYWARSIQHCIPCSCLATGYMSTLLSNRKYSGG